MAGQRERGRDLRGRASGRPRLRRALKIVGFVAGVPLLLLLLGIALLHTQPVERWIADRIEARAAERLHGTLSIGSLELSLFDGVALGDVALAGEDGEVVVSIDALRIQPDWVDLVRARTIERIELHGLAVHVVTDAAGGSNLRRLLAPRQAEPAPDGQPRDLRLAVRELLVDDVDVSLEKPDGTRLRLEDLALRAAIEVRTAEEIFRLAVPSIEARLALEKPADGLAIVVDGIELGIDVDLAAGAGTVTLPPTRAHARIEQKGAPLRELRLDLRGATIDLGAGSLGLELDRLVLGALAFDALELRGGVDEGGLEGEQTVQLVGLSIDAEKLNQLLGKKILASDVHFDSKLSGPPERIAVSAKLSAGGGELRLGGTIDASDLDHPRYRLRLTGADLDSGRLVAAEGAPAIALERLELGVRGGGVELADLEADVGLALGPLRYERHRIDEVSLQARVDSGTLQIDPLRIRAHGQTVWVVGTIDLVHQRIDAVLTLEGDVGETLERLRAAGLDVQTRLPRGALSLRQGVVTVAVRGELRGRLEADVTIADAPLAGGALAARLHAVIERRPDAAPGEKKVALQALSGVVELKEVGLRQLAALRGKKLEGMTGTVSGRVEIEDAPDAPRLSYQLTARAQPGDAPRIDPARPVVVATARGEGSREKVALDLEVVGIEGDATTPLVTGTVRAPLAGRGLSPDAPLHVELAVPRRSLDELRAFLPRRLLVDPATGEPRVLPNGTASATVSLRGTAAAPRGKIALDVAVPALGGDTQRLTVDARLESEGGKVTVDADLRGWLDADQAEVLTGKAHAELSRSPLVPGPRSLSWSLDAKLAPGRLEELADKLPSLDGVQGRARASLELSGTDRDLFGKVHVALDEVKKDERGPFDAELDLAIGRERTDLDLDVALAGRPILRAEGSVDRSGKGLLARLRSKDRSLAERLGDPPIALAVTLVDQPFSVYGDAIPKLREVPGRLGGRIDVGGSLSLPLARGRIVYHDYQTLAGPEGRAVLSFDAGAERVDAALGLGPAAQAENPPLRATIALPRRELGAYLAAKRCHERRDGACPEVRLPVEVQGRAPKVDLRSVMPYLRVSHREMIVAGTLDWRLDGRLVLDPEPRMTADGLKLPPIASESTLDGELALDHGILSIVGTRRRYHDVTIGLRHDASAVRIDRISLRESDLQRKNRKLDVEGRLALSHFRPEALDLRIRADEWLLFGQEKVGPADAPRGSLSAEVLAKGDLGRPVQRVDVEVRSLELLIPDRFARAHQPEETHLGDVIFLDEDDAPGKLPVPPRPEPAPPPPPAEAVERGLDLVVRIPNRIHVLQDPMNLYAVGEIRVKRRAAGRSVNGKLIMVGGDLALGGKKHALVRGDIVFDEKSPGGRMDLHFARREHVAALREISQASGGDHVTIVLEGPLDDRKTTLGGAGSPGTLFDLLSMHNAGRPRYKTEPDLPATNSPQFPQHDNLLLLSYLSVNVPHLLFLDKVSAWADAYDERSTESYGRIEHYESEGYAADGNLRVRMVGRPRGAGQSAAEMQLDYLFVNTRQTAVGIGATAGSRLGGGPGVVFEWSSED